MAQSVRSGANNAIKSWTRNPFENFVFVKNNGQFNGESGDEKSKVYYYTNSKGVDIYFSANGLTYSHDEFKRLDSEKERDNRGLDGRGEPEKTIEVRHH